MDESATTDPGSDEPLPDQAHTDPIVGRLVSRTFAYDGGRQVTVHVPRNAPELVVFAGDGQLISRWGGFLEAARVPPTMIVGTFRTDSEDEMVRIREYSPAFDEARFAAHEAFFVEDVRHWVSSHFDIALTVERTAVCGVSAGAELALALGLRHPDVFGSVFAASPGGGYRPPAVLPEDLPRIYLTAGTQEPFFLENATRWADALREADADVVMTERTGDHGDPFWQEEFTRMVSWAHGRSADDR